MVLVLVHAYDLKSAGPSCVARYRPVALEGSRSEI